MRLFCYILACLLTTQPTHADVVQVPLYADGTVILEEVFSGFSLTFPIFENETQSIEFTGELLGEPFAGGVIEANTMQDFALSIEAPTLSEHGNFLIAVMVTDVICARNALRPGLVLWSDTKTHKGATWEVATSCAAATE